MKIASTMKHHSWTILESWLHNCHDHILHMYISSSSWWQSWLLFLWYFHISSMICGSLSPFCYGKKEYNEVLAPRQLFIKLINSHLGTRLGVSFWYCRLVFLMDPFVSTIARKRSCLSIKSWDWFRSDILSHFDCIPSLW